MGFNMLVCIRTLLEGDTKVVFPNIFDYTITSVFFLNMVGLNFPKNTL